MTSTAAAETLTVRPSRMKEILVTMVQLMLAALKSGMGRAEALKRYMPTMVWGPPGCGKSQIAYSLVPALLPWVRKLLGSDWAVALVDLRLALLNPVDLRGMMIVVPDLKEPGGYKTIWAPPGFLKSYGEKVVVILFLDEINHAPPATQNAGFQLVLDRMVGELTVSDYTYIIGAGNPVEYNSHVYEMSAGLRSRFGHYDMTTSIDDVTDHALQMNWQPSVIAYLRSHEEDLLRYDRRVHRRNFPNPRNWERLSILLTDLDFRVQNDMIHAHVGPGTCDTFEAFLKHQRHFQTLEAALEGKKIQKLDAVDSKERLGLCHFLSVSAAQLVIRSKKREEIVDKFGRAMAFLDHNSVDPELTAVFIHDLFKLGGKRIPEGVDEHPELVKFVTKHEAIVMNKIPELKTNHGSKKE